MIIELAFPIFYLTLMVSWSIIVPFLLVIALDYILPILFYSHSFKVLAAWSGQLCLKSPLRKNKFWRF